MAGISNFFQIITKNGFINCTSTPCANSSRSRHRNAMTFLSHLHNSSLCFIPSTPIPTLRSCAPSTFPTLNQRHRTARITTFSTRRITTTIGCSLHPTESVNKYNNDSINRSIARIAIPALFTLALNPMVSLFDMYCIGKLDASAIGSIGIGNNVFNIAFTCFNFLGLATTPAIARAYAKNDTKKASKLTAQAIWVAFVSGATAAVGLSLFKIPAVSFFGANHIIRPKASIYLQARILAAPFYLMTIVGNGTFRGFQDTRTPLYVGIMANIVNLICYPTFILLLDMGIVGAGMAMAATQMFSGCVFLILLLQRKMVTLSDIIRPPRIQESLPLLRAGAVLSARTLSIFFTVAYATATAAGIGTIQVAAFEIARRFFVLCAKLHGSMTVAAQSLVSLAIGRKEYQLARTTSNQIIRIGIAMGIVFTALLLLGVNTVPRVFTTNESVRQVLKSLLPYVAIIQPICGIVFALDGVFTAGKKYGVLSAVVLFATACACTLLLTIRKLQITAVPAVWMGINVMILLRAVLLGIMYLWKWSPLNNGEREEE